MAYLLNCSICPKRPKFTDISHLLTHIGSKAHLAILHKLHIKSHDDNSAAIQYDAYNQWFDQHGLAQLLSERMAHKEKKKASKQTGATKKRATMRDNEVKAADPTASSLKQARRRGRPKKAQAPAEVTEAGGLR
jgi:hypothetical protein